MRYVASSFLCLFCAVFLNSVPTTGSDKNEQVKHDTVIVIQKNMAMFTLPQMSPLPDSLKLGSRFNPRRMHPVLRQIRPHKGLDIGCRVGTPIVSPGNGVVKDVVYNRWTGWGNHIVVVHGPNSELKTISLRYAHLSEIFVKKGDIVKMGDLLAHTGNTGTSTAPHLHLEYLVDGEAVDPENYLSFGKNTRNSQLSIEADSTQQMLFEDDYEFYQLDADEAVAASSRLFGGFSG